jgi:uncharacterized membrane protein
VAEPIAETVHPSPDSALDLARSATLGFVAGLRSLMPLALLAEHLQEHGPDIADGGWAIDWLASPGAAVVLGLAALGELIGDKLPSTPSRLDPLPLAGRVVLGGTAGALASLAEGRSSDVGAAVASVGALAGSVLGYSLRKKLTRLVPLRGAIVALGEDMLALALGRWAVRRET